MALVQTISRLIGEYIHNKASEGAEANYRIGPLAASALLLQSSIYDVPGGYRAVMFDRFSGVKDKASFSSFRIHSKFLTENYYTRPLVKEHIFASPSYSELFFMMSELNLEYAENFLARFKI